MAISQKLDQRLRTPSSHSIQQEIRNSGVPSSSIARGKESARRKLQKRKGKSGRVGCWIPAGIL
jgi:hypothetical protein